MIETATVLVVGRDPLALSLYREGLEVGGHTIVAARDDEEALLWLHGSEPGLILLDVDSAELGLLEMLRESGFDVPVIVLTDEGRVRDAVAAMKLGAVDVLAKPLPSSRLRTAVAEALARRGAEDPRTDKEAAVTTGSEFLAKFRRARLAFRDGAFGEAEVFLRQALAVQADSAEAHNLLGVLLESRNQPRGAWRQYRAALKVDPRYRPARNNLRRITRFALFGGRPGPFDTGELRCDRAD
ncbi:response regulator [Singulisphaera sp. PoT]|uniref:response regulator n=1 Tax=Singulisphaera sp. PoT TaxID=3411797 RepID=UPI003BF47A55